MPGVADGASVIGLLYRGVEDAAYSEADPEMLTRTEMTKLDVVGRPVYVEHDYSVSPVGRILDAWIDKRDPELWVAIQLHGSAELGTSMSSVLNGAVRNGHLKDLSIGLDCRRNPATGEIVQQWMEASLVRKGRYRGTHIHVRASDEGGDGRPAVDPGFSGRDWYLVPQSAKNSRAWYQTIMASAETQQPAAAAPAPGAGVGSPDGTSTDADMKPVTEVKAEADKPAAETKVEETVQKMDTEKPIEGEAAEKIMEQLAAQKAEIELLRAENGKAAEILAARKADEDRKNAEFRKKQEPLVQKFLKHAESAGVNKEWAGQFAEKMAGAGDTDAWRIQRYLMERFAELEKSNAAHEAQVKKYQDELDLSKRHLNQFAQATRASFDPSNRVNWDTFKPADSQVLNNEFISGLELSAPASSSAPASVPAPAQTPVAPTQTQTEAAVQQETRASATSAGNTQKRVVSMEEWASAMLDRSRPNIVNDDYFQHLKGLGERSAAHAAQFPGGRAPEF